MGNASSVPNRKGKTRMVSVKATSPYERGYKIGRLILDDVLAMYGKKVETYEKANDIFHPDILGEWDTMAEQAVDTMEHFAPISYAEFVGTVAGMKAQYAKEKAAAGGSEEPEPMFLQIAMRLVVDYELLMAQIYKRGAENFDTHGERLDQKLNAMKHAAFVARARQGLLHQEANGQLTVDANGKLVEAKGPKKKLRGYFKNGGKFDHGPAGNEPTTEAVNDAAVADALNAQLPASSEQTGTASASQASGSSSGVAGSEVTQSEAPEEEEEEAEEEYEDEEEEVSDVEDEEAESESDGSHLSSSKRSDTSAQATVEGPRESKGRETKNDAEGPRKGPPAPAPLVVTSKNLIPPQSSPGDDASSSAVVSVTSDVDSDAYFLKQANANNGGSGEPTSPMPAELEPGCTGIATLYGGMYPHHRVISGQTNDENPELFDDAKHDVVIVHTRENEAPPASIGNEETQEEQDPDPPLHAEDEAEEAALFASELQRWDAWAKTRSTQFLLPLLKKDIASFVEEMKQQNITITVEDLEWSELLYKEPCASMIYTHPGIAAYMGLNAHGVSVLWQYIDTGERGDLSGCLAVVTNTLIREMLLLPSAKHCLAYLHTLFNEGAIGVPNAFILSDPGHVFSAEVSAHSFYVEEAHVCQGGTVVHGNHLELDPNSGVPPLGRDLTLMYPTSSSKWRVQHSRDFISRKRKLHPSMGGVLVSDLCNLFGEPPLQRPIPPSLLREKLGDPNLRGDNSATLCAMVFDNERRVGYFRFKNDVDGEKTAMKQFETFTRASTATGLGKRASVRASLKAAEEEAEKSSSEEMEAEDSRDMRDVLKDKDTAYVKIELPKKEWRKNAIRDEDFLGERLGRVSITAP